MSYLVLMVQGWYIRTVILWMLQYDRTLIDGIIFTDKFNSTIIKMATK